HAPLLARFEVVHVGAVAVDLLPDRVAGAVAKGRAVARLVDHVSSRVIDLPALYRLALRKRRAHALYGRVAGRRDDAEPGLVLRRHRFPDEAGPRQVAVDGARLPQLRPQVDEHEVAFADDARIARLRLVVRVAAVRADGDDRRMVALQPVLLEMIEDALLH